MSKVTLIARLLLGFIFLGAGISFFFTTPPPLEGAMGDFFKGMMATQYFFYLLKGTEITCGLLLLSGMFVPLALVVLAPIILNIFLVHSFLAVEGLPLALVIGVLEIYLAIISKEYSPVIKLLFRPKVEHLPPSNKWPKSA
ncbi:MAG: acyltransferase [Bdellovibrio sp.]|nr:MAG: acyltransferase [Bdellovibrio sp.]